jgi:hypothetical protein
MQLLLTCCCCCTPCRIPAAAASARLSRQVILAQLQYTPSPAAAASTYCTLHPVGAAAAAAALCQAVTPGYNCTTANPLKQLLLRACIAHCLLLLLLLLLCVRLSRQVCTCTTADPRMQLLLRAYTAQCLLLVLLLLPPPLLLLLAVRLSRQHMCTWQAADDPRKLLLCHMFYVTDT